MDIQASPLDREPPAAKPALRVKFDRWLFDFDIDNVEAGRLLNVHPLTIGRYRKRFDDPDRRVPDALFMKAVFELTRGVVEFEDWFRPCGVAYLSDAPAVPEAAE
jgi:hypothetical protein